MATTLSPRPPRAAAHESADALIVGTGPVGAVYARCLAAGGLDVLMIDAGPQESALPGEHLRNRPSLRENPALYHEAVSSRLHPLGLGGGAANDLADTSAAVAAARHGMPRAAACYAVGGMGTLWNGIAMRLHPRLERWDAMLPAEWEAAYGCAERLLAVHHDLTAGSPLQRALLARLAELDALAARAAPPSAAPAGGAPGGPRGPAWRGLRGAEPAAAPLAARRRREADGASSSGGAAGSDGSDDAASSDRAAGSDLAEGSVRTEGAGGGDGSGPYLHFTGPADILAPVLAAPTHAGERAGRVRILPRHVALRLRHRGGRVLGAEVLDLARRRRRELRAGLVVVAGGALLGPQLLWASDVLRGGGEGSPLGRYLHDHPLAHAQVALGPEVLERMARPARTAGPALGDRQAPDAVRLPADGPPRIVIPPAEGRPFHSLLLGDSYDRRVLAFGGDRRLLVGLYWYSRMEPRSDNRLTFDPSRPDRFGLPGLGFELTLSPADRARAREALDDLRALGAALGSFLPAAPPMLLAAGSSGHYLGTLRMGRRDDGESVADPAGRVWGFSNLYVGGTGLFPAATVTNPTLTACALAVRGACGILGRPVTAAAALLGPRGGRG